MGEDRPMTQAPEWTPGMDAVTGMAAHPSMQRRTTRQLWIMLSEIDRDIDEGRRFEPSRDQRAYMALLRQRRLAVIRALEWRGEGVA